MAETKKILLKDEGEIKATIKVLNKRRQGISYTNSFLFVLILGILSVMTTSHFSAGLFIVLALAGAFLSYIVVGNMQKSIKISKNLSNLSKQLEKSKIDKVKANPK